jgi:hypothetical protein
VATVGTAGLMMYLISVIRNINNEGYLRTHAHRIAIETVTSYSIGVRVGIAINYSKAMQWACMRLSGGML